MSIRFPQYEKLGENFKAQCVEEAYDDVPTLIEDVAEGYDESSILDELGIEFKDEDKDAICNTIHRILVSFNPAPESLNLVSIVSCEVEQKEVEQMKQLVMNQAVLLNPDNQADTALLNILIIGQRNNFPLLTFLADMYGRWRVSRYLSLYAKMNEYEYQREREQFIAQYFRDVKLGDFFKEVIQKLAKDAHQTKTSQQALQWCEASLNSFFRRITYPLKIGPRHIDYKINDSITMYARYFLALLISVNYIVKNPMTSLPCQIDMWVMPRAIKQATQDDDDDSDDGFSDGDDEKEVGIDNLEGRLEFADRLQTSDITSNATMALSRTFYETFERVIRNERSKRMVMILDRRIGGQDVVENNKNYWKMQDEVEQKQKDKLYAFLPKNSQNIPSGQYLHEAMFNLTRMEVLPSTNGVLGDDSNAIHGSTSCQNMFMLSIHIHQEDVVRAYWYVNGTATRFFMNDIVDIWPYYFIEKRIDKETETEVLQSIGELKDLVKSKRNNIRLKDDNFDRFFEQNTGIKPE
eukprot:102558_1